MSRQMPLFSVVGGKYVLGKILGKGAFGQVYLATEEEKEQSEEIKSNKSHKEPKLYAIKREDESVKQPQLQYESKILKLYDKAVGFPTVYWSGQQNKSVYLCMDLLGPSLQDLFHLCGCRFSLKTVLMIADQMLYRIEQLHLLNYIHRDIKPENFLMGIEGKSHIVHVVDFGLCRKYRDPKTHQHIPYKQNKMMTGTVRYSSINTHFGFQQSRRDDLEAIGYIFIYFLKGSLPWQGIKANNKTQKYEKIQEKKLATPIEAQCKGLPIQFATFINYARSLKFQEKPDYRYLRKMFRDLMERVGYLNDYNFDWCNFQEQKQYDSNSLRIIVEKEGEEIPYSEFKKKQKQQKEEEVNLLQDPIKQIDTNDINMRLEIEENRQERESYMGQNLSESNNDDLDLGRRNSGKEQGLKLLETKNIDEW